MKNIVLHKINGENYSYRPYGICEDLENVTNKTVTLVSPAPGDNFHVFSLVEGATILVKFSHENATNGTTLNVNNTIDIPILIGVSGMTQNQTWVTEDTIEFRYDGGNWVMLNGEMSIDKTINKSFYILTDSIEDIPELPILNNDGSFDLNGWSEDYSILNEFVYNHNVLWSTTIKLNSRNHTAVKYFDSDTFEQFTNPVPITGTKGDNGTFTTTYVPSTKTLKFNTAFTNVNLDLKQY